MTILEASTYSSSQKNIKKIDNEFQCLIAYTYFTDSSDVKLQIVMVIKLQCFVRFKPCQRYSI